MTSFTPLNEVKMSFSAWVALAAVIATIYGLIKRYETRLVLFTAGLFLCTLGPAARRFSYVLLFVGPDGCLRTVR